MGPRLFCFGLGYTGRALAARLTGEGWQIAGTVRGDTTFEESYRVYPFDRDRPLEDAATALAGATHILSTVPPDEIGDPVLDCHGGDIAALTGLHWGGYLSTTGVYGDRGGGEVDEKSKTNPAGERGRRRVAAEHGWLALAREHGVPMHLFRLAGIYGPGRNALETVRQGRARRIHKPGQVFGRIHIDDIVQVLFASMERPNPGAAYNLADNEPAPPDAVIAYACELLGIEAPPLEAYDDIKDTLSPMARSFYGESKRVSNRRIGEELGVVLKWPTYREGLKGLL